MPRMTTTAVPAELGVPDPRTDAPDVRTTDFGGLMISWDERVLEPRPWTLEQADWLSDLAASAPPGPVLELCSGPGHLGLVLALDTGRRLVQVEHDLVAAAYGIANAQRAGVDTDLRVAPMLDALDPDERFALVLADPPWVPHDQVDQFPDDPSDAIDGGPRGLDLAGQCLETSARHLLPGGHVVLQLGSQSQVDELWMELEVRIPELQLVEVRERPRGALAHFRAR